LQRSVARIRLATVSWLVWRRSISSRALATCSTWRCPLRVSRTRCSLGTLECWGGRQGGCGLELCVRQLRVCGSPLAVCLVSLCLCLCVARACRHHLSGVHPYRVGVQSEPGCSSPFYLPTYEVWMAPLASCCPTSGACANPTRAHAAQEWRFLERRLSCRRVISVPFYEGLTTANERQSYLERAFAQLLCCINFAGVYVQGRGRSRARRRLRCI